jgi:outer membrane cobalamin receptor
MLKKIFTGVVGVLFLAAPAVAQNGKLIRGQVVDAQTGKPLPGANVFIVPNGAGAISDANGRFKFAATENESDSLRISFMGYRPAIIALAAITDELKIKLEATTLLFSETVVTATRQSAVRAEVPSATELIEISSPQIVARQNLGEALAQSQSIFVKEYGSTSSLKTINLRGAGDGQVLVLADGVRLNNPQNGGVDASLLSLVGIDKIEVVRGNASAQYGSDAIGGVIHLRSSLPPAGFSGALQTSAGSFGTFNSRVQFGYGRANWNSALALDRLVSDGDFPIDDSNKIKRQNNGSQRREIFARWSGNPRANLQLNFLHRTNKTEQGVPGSLQFPGAAARQKDLNHLTSAMLDWRVRPLLQLSAQFSGERRNQHYDDPAFPPASDHRVASDVGILQNRASLHPTLELLLGAELGRYRVGSTNFTLAHLGQSERERTQRSGFAQIEWRPFAGRRPALAGWQLIVMPSLRYDDYSDIDTTSFSPKLAMSLTRQTPSLQLPAARFSLHGSVGKSFRVPSMNDLWWQDAFFVGNPNLRPEKGREVEGGVLYEFSAAGNWQLELAAFEAQITNLITLTQDFYSLVNLEKAKIRGAELSAAWRSYGDRFSWRANYTRLSPRNEGSGKDLTYRPRDKFDLHANFNWRYLTMSGSFQFVGKRFTNAANSNSLQAYRVTNLSMSRKIRFDEFTALLHIEMRNVFDKHFSIIDGYPLPGREFRAALRLGI